MSARFSVLLVADDGGARGALAARLEERYQGFVGVGESDGYDDVRRFIEGDKPQVDVYVLDINLLDGNPRRGELFAQDGIAMAKGADGTVLTALDGVRLYGWLYHR